MRRDYAPDRPQDHARVNGRRLDSGSGLRRRQARRPRQPQPARRLGAHTAGAGPVRPASRASRHLHGLGRRLGAPMLLMAALLAALVAVLLNL